MIAINKLCKSYNDKYVLKNVSFNIKENRIYCLMGPSGQGKTTLLHILLGLIPADSGFIDGIDKRKISAVFQEDRLLEGYSPYANIQLITGKQLSRDKILKNLSLLLPIDCLQRPVHMLSGGMKRRVSICRAMLCNSDMIIMDEPFTGLDLETKKKVISYIINHQNNRTILITTHQEEDVRFLGATVIQLDKTNHF